MLIDLEPALYQFQLCDIFEPISFLMQKSFIADFLSDCTKEKLGEFWCRNRLNHTCKVIYYPRDNLEKYLQSYQFDCMNW